MRWLDLIWMELFGWHRPTPEAPRREPPPDPLYEQARRETAEIIARVRRLGYEVDVMTQCPDEDEHRAYH